MTIIKKPIKTTPEAAAEAFISGAPDAATTSDGPRRVRKGKKVQITLTIAEPLLDRVDELAGEIGQSRAGVINLAVIQMLQSGLRIEKNE
ncbi:CopG family transcriptional regulator [Vreelandella populi]|uniref:CopG family transcriptional regulator n=1 Tax=Vreelandella populi TaxID=2498858 RepID=UPI000F8EA20C|nr:CopG family transcriptional regulator [Halomonas populi]RUR51956.1 CopG family transcriptional regulator [Halomonas populi]